MPDLDNLIAKILGDSGEKAGQIIEAANAEASEIIRKKTLEGEKEKERILSAAKDEAARSGERILLDRKLEIRDDILAAKRKTIDKAFAYALEKLNDMPREKFLSYLRGGLKGLLSDGRGGELITPAKYEIKLQDLEGPPENLDVKGVRLNSGGREADGGFIFVKDGVEHNRMFEALIQYNRQELESEIVKILF